MFSSKKSDVFVFRKGHSTLKQSSNCSLGGHRHHVRMHIIYKAFFTLATWMPHYWLESLNLEWSMKPTYHSHGYLIFKQKTLKGWIPSEVSSPDFGCSKKFYRTEIIKKEELMPELQYNTKRTVRIGNKPHTFLSSATDNIFSKLCHSVRQQ